MKARVNGSFTNREVLLLWLSSSVLVVGLALIFFPNTLEDSYITFRYARHLAMGYGFGAWNITGERVEGYTSFLWMIYVAAADRLGIDPRVASKALGISSHLLLVSLLILSPALYRRCGFKDGAAITHPNVTVLAGVLAALYLPLAWYAASGMETVFFALLVSLSFTLLQLPRISLYLAALVVLLTLTRPEGGVVAVACIGFSWLQRRRDRAEHRYLLIAVGAFLVTLGGLLMQRVLLFHEILPNTYWAKVAGDLPLHIRSGLSYVADWLKAHYPLLFFVVVTTIVVTVSLAKGRGGELPAGLCSFLFLFSTAYAVRVGGDNYSAFPYWRHFIHVFPLVGLLACFSIVRVIPGKRSLQLLVVAAIALGIDVGILYGSEGELRMALRAGLETWPIPSLPPPNQYYRWLDSMVQDDATIASSLGGELPYVVDAVHIDILGLNTRHVAKYGTYDPGGPVDSKTDMQWVLEQRPDVIEGYMSASRIMNRERAIDIMRTWRYAMNIGLVSSPIFQTEYMFVRNAPYDSLDRALFIRKDYWMSHPMKEYLDCVEIADTVLGEEWDAPQ